jgi:hypothetical protein
MQDLYHTQLLKHGYDKRLDTQILPSTNKVSFKKCFGLQDDLKRVVMHK